MKVFYRIIALLVLVSCSSNRMVDSWKNSNYNSYTPKKVLIIGLTDNLTARKIFEERLKKELTKWGVWTFESYNVFEPTFTNLKQTEDDIQNEVQKISRQGFDAILISAVKGVDEKVASYIGDNLNRDLYWRQFEPYYYVNQDVYFVEGYYNKYKIYRIETSLYNLKENNDKSLVWVANYDIVDPKKINSTVNKYVKAIIKSLEKEGIIIKK